METSTIITFFACIIIIGIFGKILFLPFMKILKLIANSIFGGALIYIINLVGELFNFHIGINVVTSVFVRDIRNSGSNIAGNI